jgi:hypothetical protein
MILIAASLLIMPVSAKNFNIADNQNITYSSGGEGYIAVPAGALYTGSSATTLEISFSDVIAGNFGPGANLGISIPWTTSTGSTTHIPVAYFLANVPEVATFLKIVLSGFPAAILPNNIRTVSPDVVIVERHGNSITAKLTTPQTIIFPIAPGQGRPVTIPAFTIELNKVGGDEQVHKTNVLTGYTGASGYTQQIDKIGFDAEGTFTISSGTSWTADHQTMTDCYITMHGVTLYTPP